MSLPVTLEVRETVEVVKGLNPRVTPGVALPERVEMVVRVGVGVIVRVGVALGVGVAVVVVAVVVVWEGVKEGMVDLEREVVGV